MEVTKDSTETHSAKIWRFIILLILVYYLPPVLLWLRLIPFEFRFHTLVGTSVLMIGYAYVRKYSLKDLGFRKDTLGNSLFWNSCLSILLVAIMLGAYQAGWIRKPTVPSWNLFFVFYVFISSPAQEFLFRSIMFAELKQAGITGFLGLIIISAVTYSFLHVFYHDWLTLIVTLFMGFVWGIIYYKYPNFWGVTLSHAVLGVISILVGII